VPEPEAPHGQAVAHAPGLIVVERSHHRLLVLSLSGANRRVRVETGGGRHLLDAQVSEAGQGQAGLPANLIERLADLPVGPPQLDHQEVPDPAVVRVLEGEVALGDEHGAPVFDDERVRDAEFGPQVLLFGAGLGRTENQGSARAAHPVQCGSGPVAGVGLPIEERSVQIGEENDSRRHACGSSRF